MYFHHYVDSLQNRDFQRVIIISLILTEYRMTSFRHPDLKALQKTVETN